MASEIFLRFFISKFDNVIGVHFTFSYAALSRPYFFPIHFKFDQDVYLERFVFDIEIKQNRSVTSGFIENRARVGFLAFFFQNWRQNQNRST